jgi:hypothetical protein
MGCGCKNNQQTKPVESQVQPQQVQQQNENVQKAIQESMKKYYQQKTKG